MRNIKKALKGIKGLGDVVYYDGTQLKTKTANRGEVLRLASQGCDVEFAVQSFIYSVYPTTDTCIKSWYGYY